MHNTVRFRARPSCYLLYRTRSRSPRSAYGAVCTTCYPRTEERTRSYWCFHLIFLYPKTGLSSGRSKFCFINIHASTDAFRCTYAHTHINELSLSTFARCVFMRVGSTWWEVDLWRCNRPGAYHGPSGLYLCCCFQGHRLRAACHLNAFQRGWTLYEWCRN